MLELEQNNQAFKGSQLTKQARQQKTAEQLFSDFYEHHKGEALSEAAKTSIQTIIKEVRKESCE